MNSTDSIQAPTINKYVFTTIISRKSSQWHARSNVTARVVLPEPPADVDTDEEAPEEGTVEEIDNGDFLADFPDDTEASTHDFLSLTSTAWLFLSDQELELVHARIGSLDSLRLYRFSGHLRKLCLRQNFISHLDSETLHQLTKLEELDLYDNKVKTVGDALDKLSSLTWVAPRVFQYPSWIFVRVLDLSFNLLRAVPDRLECLTSLQTIYFVQNRISKISGLSSCVTLRSLELGGNKIRVGLFLSVPLSFLNLNRKLNTSTHWST